MNKKNWGICLIGLQDIKNPQVMIRTVVRDRSLPYVSSWKPSVSAFEHLFNLTARLIGMLGMPTAKKNLKSHLHSPNMVKMEVIFFLLKIFL